jgi:hypothetical protein
MSFAMASIGTTSLATSLIAGVYTACVAGEHEVVLQDILQADEGLSSSCLFLHEEMKFQIPLFHTYSGKIISLTVSFLK